MLGCDALSMFFFFFKQKTAYEIKECDWSSGRVLFRSPRLPVFLRLPPRLVPGSGMGLDVRREPAALQRARHRRRRRGRARARHPPLSDLFPGRDRAGLRPHGARKRHAREASDVGARVAQCRDSDRHQRAAPAARAARRRLPARAVLRHPGHRTRGYRGGGAQRLPGDQGGDRVRGHRHDGHQPGRRSALSGDRPARAAQMREQGVWGLAWQRFRRDRVGFGSLLVVFVYVAIMLAAAAGWVGRDWSEERALSYAPPGFVGPDTPPAVGASKEGPATANDYGIPDPLAADLAEIAKTLSGATASEAREATLAFGADKWGRDVLKKTLKGAEVSLFVGLAAAVLTTLLGTLSGALAGYRGGWVDDVFNWLYSVFTSIPDRKSVV